jgi:hypothetical protein
MAVPSLALTGDEQTLLIGGYGRGTLVKNMVVCVEYGLELSDALRQYNF